MIPSQASDLASYVSGLSELFLSIQDSQIRFPSLTSILGGSAHWQLPCQVVALIATTV